MKNRGKDVWNFALGREIPYIKKKEFRSAEGLCFKQLLANVNKSTGFGMNGLLQFATAHRYACMLGASS